MESQDDDALQDDVVERDEVDDENYKDREEEDVEYEEGGRVDEKCEETISRLPSYQNVFYRKEWELPVVELDEETHRLCREIASRVSIVHDPTSTSRVAPRVQIKLDYDYSNPYIPSPLHIPSEEGDSTASAAASLPQPLGQPPPHTPSTYSTYASYFGFSSGSSSQQGEQTTTRAYQEEEGERGIYDDGVGSLAFNDGERRKDAADMFESDDVVMVPSPPLFSSPPRLVHTEDFDDYLDDCYPGWRDVITREGVDNDDDGSREREYYGVTGESTEDAKPDGAQEHASSPSFIHSSSIPPIYFDESFDLTNPNTFEQCCGSAMGAVDALLEKARVKMREYYDSKKEREEESVYAQRNIWTDNSPFNVHTSRHDKHDKGGRREGGARDENQKIKLGTFIIS